MKDLILFKFYSYCGRIEIAWRILWNKSSEEYYTPFVAARDVAEQEHSRLRAENERLRKVLADTGLAICDFAKQSLVEKKP